MTALLRPSGAIVVAVLLVAATASGEIPPRFRGLGDLPGGSVFSKAYGVSGDGRVVVGEGGTSAGRRGFRWTAERGMLELGLTYATNGIASAVSPDGSIAVGSATTGIFGNRSAPQWYAWDEEGNGTGIVVEGVATGVSEGGGRIVGTWEPNGGAGIAAFIEGVNDLPPKSIVGGQASAISNDGSVICGSTISTEAFVFRDPDLGWEGLGDPYSKAWDVSGDATFIVGEGNAFGRLGAFRWTQDSGIVDLGDIPGSLGNERPYGVSVNGVVVGWAVSDLQGTETEAFIWREGEGMQFLRNVLASDFGVDFSGWRRLDEATSISDDGTVVVGWGTRVGGPTEAWVAYVPEPAIGWPAMTAALLLLTLRRRCGYPFTVGSI